MNRLKKLKYTFVVMLLFGFVAAISLNSCRKQKKKDNTEQTDEHTAKEGDHPEGEHPKKEGEEHPEGEHPKKDGEEHPEGEHPNKDGEEHPEGEHPNKEKDTVSG